MKSSKCWAVAVSLFLIAAASDAAHVDFKDPKRALGREDDVRVDAELTHDVLNPGGAIAFTYQIENLTPHAVAVADKVVDASYDADSRTITLSVGAEVPSDGLLPHMTIIVPGEKKVFTASALCRMLTPAAHTPFANVPRFVEIKVNVMRDVRPFEAMISKQARGPEKLTDEQFEKWIESNAAVILNDIPIQWSYDRRGALPEASADSPRSAF